MHLGSGYDTLRVNLSASPRERHPSSIKCTMPSPHSHRHLRHVTGVSALRVQDQQAEHEVQGAKEALESVFSEGPTGGRVHVKVEASNVVRGTVPPPPGSQAPPEGRPAACAQAAAPEPHVPRLDILVEGRGLHAPIIERLIELPMDISAGRVRACPALAWACSVPMRLSLLGAVGCQAAPNPTQPRSKQADGELRICSHDAASWHFPEFYGRVAVRCDPCVGLDGVPAVSASSASPLPPTLMLLCSCRGADFHFWDATDDITGADLDLFFERDRLYLHNARGSFGAVPMTLSGVGGVGMLCLRLLWMLGSVCLHRS